MFSVINYCIFSLGKKKSQHPKPLISGHFVTRCPLVLRCVVHCNVVSVARDDENRRLCMVVLFFGSCCRALIIAMFGYFHSSFFCQGCIPEFFQLKAFTTLSNSLANFTVQSPITGHHGRAFCSKNWVCTLLSSSALCSAIIGDMTFTLILLAKPEARTTQVRLWRLLVPTILPFRPLTSHRKVLCMLNFRDFVDATATNCQWPAELALAVPPSGSILENSFLQRIQRSNRATECALCSCIYIDGSQLCWNCKSARCYPQRHRPLFPKGHAESITYRTQSHTREVYYASILDQRSTVLGSKDTMRLRIFLRVRRLTKNSCSNGVFIAIT